MATTEPTEYCVTVTNPDGSCSYMYITARDADRAREIAEWHLFARCSQGIVTDVTDEY